MYTLGILQTKDTLGVIINSAVLSFVERLPSLEGQNVLQEL